MVTLSGATRRAAKGRFWEMVAAWFWIERQVWRLVVIWVGVGRVRGGKRVGWAASAAVEVRALVALFEVDILKLICEWLLFVTQRPFQRLFVESGHRQSQCVMTEGITVDIRDKKFYFR